MLLETLLQKQRDLGLTDAQFAAELQLSRPFWTNVRKENRRITVAVLRATLKRFPELEPEVLDFLKSEG